MADASASTSGMMNWWWMRRRSRKNCYRQPSSNRACRVNPARISCGPDSQAVCFDPAPGLGDVVRQVFRGNAIQCGRTRGQCAGSIGLEPVQPFAFPVAIRDQFIRVTRQCSLAFRTILRTDIGPASHQRRVGCFGKWTNAVIAWNCQVTMRAFSRAGHSRGNRLIGLANCGSGREWCS